MFVLDHDKLEVRISDQGHGVEQPDFSLTRIIEEQNLDSGMHRGFWFILAECTGR
ncbi:MAG: hypothetical protein U0074_01190 [Kouleothrix sp.]